MTLDDILRLPNTKPYTNLEINMIKRFFHDFPYMRFWYGSGPVPSDSPEAFQFLHNGILGVCFGEKDADNPVVVAKLSEGRKFLVGERLSYHVFNSSHIENPDFKSFGPWKLFSRLLIKIGNADHYPK